MDAIIALKQQYIHAKNIVKKMIEDGVSHPMIELSPNSHNLPDTASGICYLSHPYERPKTNILQAGEIAHQLRNALGGNCTVLSLIHNWPFGCPEVVEDRAYWLELYHSMEVMSACETVFMAPGWENSLGCCVEYLRAMSLGKNIFIVKIKEEEK